MNGLEIARDRIAREADERTGFLDLGQLALEALPAELFALTHLRTLVLGSNYLDEAGKFHFAASDLGHNTLGACAERLVHLVWIEGLFLANADVGDLGFARKLARLRFLDIRGSATTDLTPLSGHKHLEWLDCAGTSVSDLGPLSCLPTLQSVDCSRTGVSDLGPLSGLPKLQSVNCSGTGVSDLAPMSGLSRLQSLLCWGTNVSDLGPLSCLPNLQSVNCSDTGVSDLGPLSCLPTLQSLDCAVTDVSDLGPLAGLPHLQSVDCSGTDVSDLGPLSGCTALVRLDCSRCRLARLEEDFWRSLSLERLILYEARLPGVPSEVLSADPSDNCFPALLAHDLAAGVEQVTDVKLMVLGNGRVGKTQLCRRLRGEGYDAAQPSTHGVVVRSVPLTLVDGEQIGLNVWDFGGQDIYHGTHALFLKTRAVFCLLWAPHLENAREEHAEGFVFRNQPLAYWLDYVRHFSAAESPVLVVQAQCDRPEDEAVRPPVPDEMLGAFAFRKILAYSAREDRGRPALDDALRQAAAWLSERHGMGEIGRGRAEVKRRIEAMRDEDASRSPGARQHRTMSRADFEALCADVGGIGSPRHLLAYLHHAGTVFHREGVFEDAIVIDQEWALDAIYAIFHREKSYGRIARQKGRFKRRDLGDWIWDEAGFGARDQELFVEMMRSCGICFAYRAGDAGREIETEYVAPDLLPSRQEVALEIEQKWDDDAAVATETLRYTLLPPALMRQVISRIGERAGIAADYWRDGVYVYERGTRSRGLIEQERGEGWSGSITVRAQGAAADELLDRLLDLIEEEQARTGADGAREQGNERKPRGGKKQGEVAAAEPQDELRFEQEPRGGPEYAVSYAWGDASPEGRDRETIVDRLCDEAAARGITILRDRNELKLGDSLSRFMQRLGRGDRVFVILSEKYLQSPYCMFELFAIWRNARQEDEPFLKRVRVFTVKGTPIWQPADRARRAVFWRQKSKELEDLVSEHGYDILGEKDHAHYRQMKEFTHHVGDILALLADTLQPRDFDELKACWFD